METIGYSVDGHVATITINRPEVRNAVNADVANGIESAIDRVEADGSVWLAILTALPPVFSSGADLKEIAAGRVADLSTKRGGFAGFVHRDRTKPVIAAVEGPALAGGTEIILACDLVVASRAASFGIPEVKRCLLAGGGGLFRLPRKLPFNVAMEMALTGDPIDAEQAYHFGLVNHLCEPGAALDEAKKLAGRIETSAPVAVRESRSVVLNASFGDEGAAWKLSGAAFSKVMASEDHKEGPAAFIEKRPPVWTGR